MFSWKEMLSRVPLHPMGSILINSFINNLENRMESILIRSAHYLPASHPSIICRIGIKYNMSLINYRNGVKSIKKDSIRTNVKCFHVGKNKQKDRYRMEVFWPGSNTTEGAGG